MMTISPHTLAASASGMNAEELAVLLLALGGLLGTARLFGECARRLGQPAIVGELLAGIFLGPTIVGTLAPDLFNWLYIDHDSARIALDGFIHLSAVLLLLTAGLELELSTAWRQGTAALLVAIIGMAVPFGGGFALAWYIPSAFGPEGAAYQPLAFAIFIGIALSITALPVIAKVLMDLNIFKSDLAVLIMSSAMLNDLIGWMGVAFVMALIKPVGAEGAASVPHTLLLTVVFLVSLMTIGRFLIHRSLPYIQAYGAWPGAVIGFVLTITFLCAAATEVIGIHAIFGAFIAGVAIGDSHHLRERTRDTIHQFITNIFAPVFFAAIGLHVNFISSFNPLVVALVVTVACTGKIAGCFIAARLAGMPSRESLAVSSGMIAQGTMGVILGQIAIEQELITDQMFVAIVFMALLTTVISGPAIQRVLRHKQPLSLGDLLTEDNFLPQIMATNSKDAIRELSESTAPRAGLDTEKVFNAVWQREQIMRTGIGQGIAVPHARLIEIQEPVISIGRSAGGIDFDSVDGKPAHIICLILTPLDDQAAQIQILRMVAEAFNDPDRRATALATKTYTEFLAALKLPGITASSNHTT